MMKIEYIIYHRIKILFYFIMSNVFRPYKNKNFKKKQNKKRKVNDNINVLCVNCEQIVIMNATMIPCECILKNGDKIADPLNMIPMKMRKEEMIIPDLIRERITITPNPKSGIEDQGIVAIFNFNATGMRAKHNLVAFGHANLSSNPPKYNTDRIGIVLRCFHHPVLAPRSSASNTYFLPAGRQLRSRC